ncbi:MAG: hypothetical protein R3B70_40215 [Polyangiaceae bacterium]
MTHATTGKTPLSPRLADDFEGLSIALAPRETLASPLVIHGVFRIPWPEADRLGPSLHRLLVLVVNGLDRVTTVAPFREQVLFPDDETPGRAGRQGYFNLDVRALTGPLPARSPFARVSLGPFVSNALPIEDR